MHLFMSGMGKLWYSAKLGKEAFNFIKGKHGEVWSKTWKILLKSGCEMSYGGHKEQESGIGAERLDKDFKWSCGPIGTRLPALHTLLNGKQRRSCHKRRQWNWESHKWQQASGWLCFRSITYLWWPISGDERPNWDKHGSGRFWTLHSECAD